MAFSREEFQQAIQNIGTCENEAERRGLLATLQDEITGVLDSNAELETNNQNLTNENTTLLDENRKLFLRVGVPEDKQDPKTKTGIDNPPEKRKFEDLFDEKGGIK